MEPNLIQAIGRLEAVLAMETGALKAGEPFSLAEASGRKNQSLLELSRMARGLKADSISPELTLRLQGLRQQLDDNQRTLKLHVEASEEIAGVIASSIKHAESDGTYGDAVKQIKRAR
ncbi:flagellar protein FlgN [Mangrovicella endophytica]|uniref:flagellar protein FlgN n=1 Tax=Mangrovicella endophytica TaxID=2066697 RepID=UPI000C9E754E|nr:flagellar protein FlgN [Mangrovicella endophytica]